MKLDDDTSIVNEKMITELESQVSHLNENLDPLKEFILPGGDNFSANLHLARAVTRRAERSAVALYEHSLSKNPIVMYLNRLSDYFFVLSRYHNKINDLSETTWKR